MQNFFKKYANSHPYWQILMIGYIIIIILCVSVNLIWQTYSIKAALEEYTNTNNYNVQRIVNLFESDFYMIESMAYLLSTSNDAAMISKSTEQEMITDSSYVKSIIRDINFFGQMSPYFNECFMIFKDRDICLTGDGKYTKMSAYELFFSNYYDSMDEWISDIFTSSAKKHWKAVPKHNETWLIGYSNEQIFSAGIATVVKLNKSVLNKNLTDTSSEDYGVLNIFNYDGILIYSNDEKLKVGTEINDLTENHDHFYNESKYIIRKFDNDTHTRKYIYSIPKSVILSKANEQKLIFLFVCLISVVGGMAFAVFLTKVSYSPVEDLMCQLGKTDKEQTSEFNFILSRLNEFKHDRNTLLKTFNQKAEKTKKDILRQVLCGDLEVHSNSMSFYLENDLPFDGDVYAVLAFSISNLGDLDQNKEEDTALAHIAIINVFREFLTDVVRTEYTDVSGTLICLVVFDDTDIPYKEYIKSRIVQTAAFLEKNMSLTFTCSVSEVQQDICELPVLFDQAMELITLDEHTSESPCVFYSDMSKKSLYEYTNIQQMQLYNLVNICDGEQASKLIKSIFEHNTQNNKLSIELQRNLLFELLGTVLKSSADNFEKNSSKFIDIPHFRLANTSQIARSLEELCEYTKLLCSENLKLRDSHHKKAEISEKAEIIRQYINENFYNSNLNVNILANHFNLSPSHISRLFKKYDKRGIANYIATCRVEKAKEILTKTNKTISAVAAETGFINANMFIRTFKKITGVTPGQYRQSKGC